MKISECLLEKSKCWVSIITGLEDKGYKVQGDFNALYVTPENREVAIVEVSPDSNGCFTVRQAKFDDSIMFLALPVESIGTAVDALMLLEFNIERANDVRVSPLARIAA